MFKNLIILGIATLVFASCSKKEEPAPTPEPPKPTTQELLSAKAWKNTTNTLTVQVPNSTPPRDTILNVTLVNADTWRFNFEIANKGTAIGVFGAGSVPFTYTVTADTAIAMTYGSPSTQRNYVFKNNQLKGSFPGTRLTVVDQNGQPQGTITGTLVETWIKVD